MSLALAMATAGCGATLQTYSRISDPSVAQTAVVADLPGVRFWGDQIPKNVLAGFKARMPNLPRMAQNAKKVKGRPVVEILALSGGGGDGAFGAGILSGWSKNKTRPEFEVVTGVSAGAIIAPFAFLGPEYDEALEDIWTGYKTSQIATAQILPGLLGGDSLADTGPMKTLIAKYVNLTLLTLIAKEYERGRILLIGTTNLDAQRPVFWNMGELARSGHKDALELFRNVIMASAAIPGAFPPVNITVSANGKTFSELHVDGGTTRELFVAPINVPLRVFDKLYDKRPIRHIFIIKNGKVNPEQEIVPRKTLPITARAISTLIKNQSLGETYRIYRRARDDGASFRYIAVPAGFNVKSKEFFDPAYQRALFDEGFKLGKAGVPWLRKPPDTSEITP